MTKSHWCDRLRPICSGGGGSGRLRACGMREMNRCDICYDWNAQMSAMPGMWVQSAVCADVARCGSGMSGMWAWLSRQLHYNGEAIISLLLVLRPHRC